MISKGFTWTIYITYIRTNKKTKRRNRNQRTVRYKFNTKQACLMKLNSFGNKYREIISYVILDEFYSLERYIET